MNFKIALLAIAVLFLASNASAYYVWGGSYGALEYPNSYYNYYYSGYGANPYYGSYNYYYNYTPYSTYYYSYSNWQPYSAYYYPTYYPSYYYPSYYYPAYDKEFHWKGFGFNFSYMKNYR